MANADAKKGLWPIKSLVGGQVRTAEYVVAVSQTIYRGDAVKIASGQISVASIASATTDLIGVAVHKVVTDASSTGTLKVYDDPEQLFGIQTVTGTSAAASLVGQTAKITAGSGSSTYNQSTHELDISSLGTTTAFMVMGIYDTPSNNWSSGGHTDVVVRFNQHRFKAPYAAT